MIKKSFELANGLLISCNADPIGGSTAAFSWWYKAPGKLAANIITKQISADTVIHHTTFYHLQHHTHRKISPFLLDLSGENKRPIFEQISQVTLQVEEDLAILQHRPVNMDLLDKLNTIGLVNFFGS